MGLGSGSVPQLSSPMPAKGVSAGGGGGSGSGSSHSVGITSESDRQVQAASHARNMTVRKLGYDSPSVISGGRGGGLVSAASQGKRLLQLPVSVFVQAVLDFQLRSHEEYLHPFKEAFTVS